MLKCRGMTAIIIITARASPDPDDPELSRRRVRTPKSPKTECLELDRKSADRCHLGVSQAVALFSTSRAVSKCRIEDLGVSVHASCLDRCM